MRTRILFGKLTSFPIFNCVFAYECPYPRVISWMLGTLKDPPKELFAYAWCPYEIFSFFFLAICADIEFFATTWDLFFFLAKDLLIGSVRIWMHDSFCTTLSLNHKHILILSLHAAHIVLMYLFYFVTVIAVLWMFLFNGWLTLMILWSASSVPHGF